jgi:hypothetical protein
VATKDIKVVSFSHTVYSASVCSSLLHHYLFCEFGGVYVGSDAQPADDLASQAALNEDGDEDDGRGGRDDQVPVMI